MDKNKHLYIDFEAYKRVAEPHKSERAAAWHTAIGLQDVDGLKVSDYLKETAVRHIEGDISIDDVREQLKSYYVNKTTHDEGDAEKEEADRVAANITKLLSEQSFSFTALEVLNIHRHLFDGVFKHAGEIRTYDISKKEWVLQGDTVVYGRAADIMMALRYDIQQEKDFSYKGLSSEEMIAHIVDFVTLLWQNHPFREGNTRTTAVFIIKYLRSIGFKVDNDLFAHHSWYFRNALVRANYRNIQKGIEYSPVYLVRFFRNLLLKDGWVLKNRYLHIRPTDDWKEQPNLKDPHYNKTLQKVDRKSGQKSESVDRKGGQKTKVSIIRMIKDNPSISSIEMANLIGINRSAISKHLKKLKEDHIIKREGPAKGGKWIIITS